MAVTYGFFNSINDDRLYNAEQITMHFKGLISEKGVFENVDGALQVIAGTGLTVNIQKGRALIDYHWVNLDAVETVTLNTPHATLNRYTAIVLELNATNREITVKTVDGTNATTPIKPAIVNTSTIKQICLAYVYVAAGATSISQSAITDTRADTTICGWITGLIDQVDTSTLFLQWQTAYEEAYADLIGWTAAQKAEFDAWYEALTEELQVNTYNVEYRKSASLTSSSSTTIPLDMTGYTYDSTDIISVYINGLEGIPSTDYNITTSGGNASVVLTMSLSGVTLSQEIDIRVLKNRIGWTQG